MHKPLQLPARRPGMTLLPLHNITLLAGLSAFALPLLCWELMWMINNAAASVYSHICHLSVDCLNSFYSSILREAFQSSSRYLICLEFQQQGRSLAVTSCDVQVGIVAADYTNTCCIAVKLCGDAGRGVQGG